MNGFEKEETLKKKKKAFKSLPCHTENKMLTRNLLHRQNSKGLSSHSSATQKIVCGIYERF
jgi:hypothetical protein